MTSLIILLIIVAVYVYLRRINPPDEIRAYEYPVSNGKTGVNSVADIASLLHSRGERLRGIGHADIDHLKETFKTELPFSYCQFLF
ncbi:MAG TPA: hypothetical protein VM488_02375, partial [Pseudobacter sp.]|nr:hypothetical protein [Pseudobacter sp.]